MSVKSLTESMEKLGNDWHQPKKKSRNSSKPIKPAPFNAPAAKVITLPSRVASNAAISPPISKAASVSHESPQKIVAENLPSALEETLNFTCPERFYSSARKMKRRIFYRHGPANSSKTHDALDKFRKAKHGIYCAPLRLMAKEVFESCQNLKVDCDLRTGEEIINTHTDGEEATHFACTVHCCDLYSKFDVAVIDEIQLIYEEECGWAYTRALLGLQAKTVILCGDNTALDLVDRLLSQMGETVTRMPHTRPTPLKRVPSLGGSYDNAEQGDCFVCFNKRDIRDVAKALHECGKPAAIIYGTLPPEVKKRQAELFNQGQKDVLIATDAVGMGLNYCIRRVIFYRLTRRNTRSGELEPISAAKAQQIAGRAGRMYNKYDIGLVTTFVEEDYMQLETLLDAELTPGLRAGILPDAQQVQKFCNAFCDSKNFEETPSLSKLIPEFEKSVQIDNKKYFLCYMKEIQEKAKLLKYIQMPFEDKYSFCQAPLPIKEEKAKNLLVDLANRFANKSPLNAEDFFALIRMTNFREIPTKTREDLEQLEYWATGCTLYIWFSNQYSKYYYDSQTVQSMAKELNTKIDYAVDHLGELVTPIKSSKGTRRPFRSSKFRKN